MTNEEKSRIATALVVIANNFNLIAETLGVDDIADDFDENGTPATQKKATKSNGISRKAKEDGEDLPDLDGEITEDDLNGLSFNNLRKIAKQLGADTTGSRTEVIEHILEAKNGGKGEDEDEDDAPKSNKSTKKTAAKPDKKSPIKMAKKSDEDEDADDEDEDEDEIEAQVNEAVADMSTEEIADFLADSGIRVKGKREALIAAVIKAVRDGTIELEDDGEDEDEKPAPKSDKKSAKKADKSKSDEDGEDDEEDAEYGVNDFNNPDMTSKRKKALQKYRKSLDSDFENGDITEDELREWATDNSYDAKSVKKMKGEKLLEEYYNATALLIDDEGNEIDTEGDDHEPYEVNGVPYCCGSPLTYDKKHKTYKCEICGGEYEE